MFLVLRVMLVAKDNHPGKENIVAEFAVGSRDKSKNGGARDFIPRRKLSRDTLTAYHRLWSRKVRLLRPS